MLVRYCMSIALVFGVGLLTVGRECEAGVRSPYLEDPVADSLSTPQTAGITPIKTKPMTYHGYRNIQG